MKLNKDLLIVSSPHNSPSLVLLFFPLDFNSFLISHPNAPFVVAWAIVGGILGVVQLGVGNYNKL